MAIAGVGSVAASLADGLAREGRVILGGDLSFNLIQREASADGARLPRTRGPRLGGRHHARDGAHRRRAHRAGRDEGGRRRLSALRRGRARSRRSRSPTALARARRRLRRRRRSGAAGAARSQAAARGSRSARRPSRSAPRSLSEPDKLAGGIGFGPRLLVSEQALRATGLLQPGSLVRWHYRLRLAGDDAATRRCARDRRRPAQRFPQAGWDIRTPHQRLAGARAQRRALHAISDAGRD